MLELRAFRPDDGAISPDHPTVRRMPCVHEGHVGSAAEAALVGDGVTLDDVDALRAGPGAARGGLRGHPQPGAGQAVDTKYREMVDAGYQSYRPAGDLYGARYAIIVDPDGNEVSLRYPLAP